MEKSRKVDSLLHPVHPGTKLFKTTRIPMVAPLWMNRDYLTTINMSSVFWQLSVSSQLMVKSLTLNIYISLFNLKLCTHIWSTNINFRPPLHWSFRSVLV